MKYIIRLQEFLAEELDEYRYFKYEIFFEESDELYEWYRVEVKDRFEVHEKTLYFRLDKEVIAVDMSEDSFQEVCSYNYSIKYFWMALLSWNIGG